jgi:hypothetical protein
MGHKTVCDVCEKERNYAKLKNKWINLSYEPPLDRPWDLIIPIQKDFCSEKCAIEWLEKKKNES